MIGVIVPSLSNSVFSDVLRGIYEGVAGTNWHIQIGNSRYSTQEEERLVRLFIGQGPTALIVTGIDQTDTTRTLLEKAACPVVQIMELTDTPIDMVVGFDHQAAAKDMVGHLVENGYRRIAAISARMDPRVQRRQESCRAALQEAGLYDPDLEISTDAPSSTTTGRQLVEKMLKKHPDIDAFFCHNDDLALGCLFACQAAGLRVPDDIGISGFNDMEFMTSACPPLTSITTHRFEMGKQAVDLALQTADGKVPTRQIINLGYDLALRASTGRRYRP